MESLVYDGLDLSNARRLIEIGVGSGAQAAIILRRNALVELTGIDISAEQVAHARARLEGNPSITGRFNLETADAVGYGA